MLKYALIATLLICLSSTAHAAPFTCKVSGEYTQPNYVISKGKIGPYTAKIVGQNVELSTPRGKYTIRLNGAMYLSGRGQGKIHCDMAKVRLVIVDG